MHRRPIIAHIVLVASAALTLLPLVWMLGTSFKASSDMINPIPLHPTLANFREVITTQNIGRQLVNSALFSAGVTLGQILIAIPAAYSFARYSFLGAHVLFSVMIFSLSVPFVVFYIPNYLLMSRLGLLNTLPGLILPQIASAYGIFLLRQRFRSFSQELVEAARLDGASEIAIMTRIVLPAAHSTIYATAVFIFINTWNDLVWPMLVTNSRALQVLTVGLTQFASVESGTKWGPMMAAAVLTAAPTLIAYLILRRNILAVALEGAHR
jgi:sn-glycerol 3-phosphate transport system permease protein